MLLRSAAAAVAAVLVVAAPTHAARGVVSLDSLTFDKVVDGSRAAVVKFDKQYAYGDKEDAWKAFAADMADSTLLVTEVGVQDYGDKENDDLREKYSVEADAFPVFKMFRPSSTEPLTFEGDVTTDALKLWAKTNAGVRIGLKGSLPSFDDLAADLVAGRIKAEDAIAKGKQAMKDLNDETSKKTAELYAKMFGKIGKEGNGFVAKETARVKKLMAGKISDSKMQMLELRKNLLASFSTPEAKEPAKDEL